MRTHFNTSLTLLLCLILLSIGTDTFGQKKELDQQLKQQKFARDSEEQPPSSQEIYDRVTHSLRELGYPVNQLSTGASYIPDQLMVWYPEEELGNIEKVREKGEAKLGKGFKVVKSCGCQGKFQIDLYELNGMDANEEGSSGSSKASKGLGIKEEDQQDNLYLLPYIPNRLNPHATQYSTLRKFKVKPSGKAGAPVVIAVLDTGIDYKYQNNTINGEPQLVFWNNTKDPVDGKDDPNDPFCKTDDIIGWDFVNDDNNPMDDHSHGTHISGIIAEQLRQNEPDVNYQLMALKVMDENGVGNTFDAVCGILYAAEKGAKVINASWGYYGAGERLLKRAIRYAGSKGAIVVNSAGNERTDLAVTNYYPAEYSIEAQNSLRTLMFVAASDQNGGLWPSTNFRTEGIYQDGFVTTPGENIFSLIPMHLGKYISPYKSGTSMAAPVMSAIMASYIHHFPNYQAGNVRPNVLQMIFNTIPSRNITRYGNTYPYYPVEWLDFSP